MKDIEALAAKLREAEETIRQPQTQFKEIEAERYWYVRVGICGPIGSMLHFREYRIGPVRVHHAVHEAIRIVWIREVRLLPALN